MNLTNAEFEEIKFETISSDGDASSEDMDADELDDVIASMIIEYDVIIVPRCSPSSGPPFPKKKKKIPAYERGCQT